MCIRDSSYAGGLGPLTPWQRDNRVTAAEDTPYTAAATLNNLRQREHSSDERARVQPWEIPFERMSSVRKEMPRLTGTQRTRRRHQWGSQTSTHTPVTYDRCTHIEGPFYHGTKSAFEAGAELVPGYGSDFQQGRVSNNIYFTALVETAAWGAELATALAGSGERGHIYVVEPMGPFEDDPNVTNKRFPGNPTQSYRTRHPLRVLAELESWQGHAPEVLKGMLDHLAQLREQGLDVIED